MRRTLAGLLLFGISFGYVEAAVVIYLRSIYEPLRQKFTPGQPPGELFPLLDLERLRTEEPKTASLLAIELPREAATLLMIAGAALLVTGVRKAWLPAFAVAFGVWDISFYVFLKVLIGWPASLATWDLLFLVPVPWAAPVWAPIVTSISVVACGCAALARPLHPGRWHWIAMAAGCLLVLHSFTADFGNLIGGAIPHHFAWLPFVAGEVLGVAAFVHARRLRPGS